MEEAIHLLGRKNVRVVAIIVRDVSLAGLDLLKHKLLPKDRNPIPQWHPQDAGWKNVSEGIQQGIDDFNWKWALSSFLQEERVRQQSAGLLNKRYGRSINHCSISRIDIKPSILQAKLHFKAIRVESA